MSESSPHAVTRILEDIDAGRATASELLALVYDDLRSLARSHVRHQPRGGTLQATALVHEVAGRLLDTSRATWKDKAHFFAVAGRAMRQVLADHARRRRAAKRGHDWHRVTLAAVPDDGADTAFDLIAIDEALTGLAGLHERMARVVECRFLAGMTVREIAHVLSVSVSTVEDDWRTARAWLRRSLR